MTTFTIYHVYIHVWLREEKPCIMYYAYWPTDLIQYIIKTIVWSFIKTSVTQRIVKFRDSNNIPHVYYMYIICHVYTTCTCATTLKTAVISGSRDWKRKVLHSLSTPPPLASLQDNWSINSLFTGQTHAHVRSGSYIMECQDEKE